MVSVSVCYNCEPYKEWLNLSRCHLGYELRWGQKTIVLGECLNPQRKNKFCGDISRHTVKNKEHLVCGQYSQSHSVGGISNVDFCSQSCSNLLLIIITTMKFSYTTTPQDFYFLNCLRCLCINISWILINVTMHSHTNNVNSRKSFQMVQDLKFQHMLQ